MKKNKSSKLFVKICMIVLFLLIAVMILLPFWAIFVGTFQEGSMLIRYGLNLKLDLSAANFDNWVMLFTDSGDYFTWFFNKCNSDSGPGRAYPADQRFRCLWIRGV